MASSDGLTAASLIVISDLHIGAGPLDDFDTRMELEFVAFLRDLEGRVEPIELIINGDFLEFVQAEPWADADLSGKSHNGLLLCFTEAQSLAKLSSIVRLHPSVFAALGGFLKANPGHRIVVMPGNHDADFF